MKKRIICWLLAISILCIQSFELCASENPSTNFMDKIDAEVIEKMNTLGTDEKIPVYVWRNNIDENQVDEEVEKAGYNVEHYEYAGEFEKNIVPQIKQAVELRLASFSNSTDKLKAGEYSLLSGKLSDDIKKEKLLNEEISKKMDEYVGVKRQVVRKLCDDLHNKFLKNYKQNEEDIVYQGAYSSTMIINATAEEIKQYAQDDTVEMISLYEEVEGSCDMDYVPGQIGMTESIKENYDGTAVKIGIIEFNGGRFDPNHPQLKSIVGKKLFFVDNVHTDGTKVDAEITKHANYVTSIIVGQSVVVNNRTFCGIVPNATVYQCPVDTNLDLYNAITILANKGCKVINTSGTLRDDANEEKTYTCDDREVDRLINNANISYVSSAGNDANYVKSPAKGLNVITVGNARTKMDEDNLLPYGGYSILGSSDYNEPDYLPNKPDIVAPGTYINFVEADGTMDSHDGTSFSAPIVTSIIASMISRNYNLQNNPVLTKAKLLLAADDSAIVNSSSNPIVGNYLREKSGAGFANLYNAISAAGSSNYENLEFDLNNTSDNTRIINSKYFYAGDKIRIVLTYDYPNNTIIDEVSDLNDLDLYFVKAGTNKTVASSISHTQNVEIIEYTFKESGYYYFKVLGHRLRSANETLHASVAWKVD